MTLRENIAQDFSPAKISDRIVPPTGHTAQLTFLTSIAMAFLAVFAFALSSSSSRLAQQWSAGLAQSATLRISAPADQLQLQTQTALKVLETTSGIASFRVLSEEEQAELLAPWFGPDVPVDQLPLPQLIEISEEGNGFDSQGLRMRLAAEVPGAILDDHQRWRKPVVNAARGLRGLSYVILLVIAGVMASMITLAASAALAANAQVISVLRLVGAHDVDIAQAFVRRFTLRAFSGGALGAAIGVIFLWLMPEASTNEGQLLTALGFEGWSWGWPIFIAPFGAVVAHIATRSAALRELRGLS